MVPSPATSDVFEATSLTSFAPCSRDRSSRSISLLTVTPSLVTVGTAERLVDDHVAAGGAHERAVGDGVRELVAPLSIRSRASRLNLTSLAAICRHSLRRNEG